MIDYARILTLFYSGKSWVLVGDEYEGLNWTDSSPKPTKEELDSKWQETKSIYNKEQCKDKAKQLLSLSDWSTLPDVQIQLSNYQDFVNYRSQLRNLVINPVENPVFPSEPEARWK